MRSLFLGIWGRKDNMSLEKVWITQETLDQAELQCGNLKQQSKIKKQMKDSY